ncbi:MAG: PIN domain-containing protein, partial [Patescibacteria group bacterium]|nr:PIN domain-containing protein [Patescibacteria group bacterium]
RSVKKGICEASGDIKKSWKIIQEYKRIKLIQIKRPIENGVDMALALLKHNNIKPRDAFHLATASSHNISQIVAKDKKLVKKSKIGIGKQFTFLEF